MFSWETRHTLYPSLTTRDPQVLVLWLTPGAHSRAVRAAPAAFSRRGGGCLCSPPSKAFPLLSSTCRPALRGQRMDPLNWLSLKEKCWYVWKRPNCKVLKNVERPALGTPLTKCKNRYANKTKLDVHRKFPSLKSKELLTLYSRTVTPEAVGSHREGEF